MPRKHRFIAALAGLTILMGVFLSGCSSKVEVAEKPALSVSTDKVRTTDVSELMTYSGIARGREEATVMPETSARVIDVYVKAGDYVDEGQVLITLDSRSFDASVAQASAGVEQASTGVEAAMARVLQAQAGVEQAKAAKEVADIQAEQARLNYERTQSLYDAGAVSKSQLEAAKAAYDQALAGVPEAAVAAAEANVDAAISGVTSSQAAVGVAEAGLQAAEVQASKGQIVAPISGIVGNVNLTPGNMASPASAAVVVSDLSEIEISISVGESEISYMNEGSQVDVAIRAVQDTPFTGRVVSVSPVSDATRKTFTVKITVPNPGNLIKSGMFAEVKASTISRRNVLCVPVSAVVPRGARSVVYVLDENNRAKEIEVETGISNDVLIEITKGLEADQVIVTKGNTLLNAGTLVSVSSQEAK